MSGKEKNKEGEMSECALSVKNLSVAYSKKPVLWDINFNMPKGELIAIVGPNGAGKSTLLRTLLNLVPRISGKIEILGQPYKKVQQSISYIPQRKSVDWDYPITVQDLVAMGLYPELKWYRKLSNQHIERIRNVLDQVDLLPFANRQISQLSGGQQQRAFMARSLIQNADIFFMDEPFAGIDMASEKAIFNVISSLKQAQKTIVIVHHNLSMIKEYFDFVVMLNLRLIATGPVNSTFTDENISKTYMGRLTLLENVAQKMLEKGV